MQGILAYEAGMPAGGGKCRYRTTKMLNQGQGSSKPIKSTRATVAHAQ